ncbi:MAG: zinc-binding dehydrogenase [Bacillota bacterium]
MVRAAVMTGPDQPLELVRFANPQLEPGGMVLETIYSEVCGTDVHLWRGRLSGVPYPIIPGHVTVGRVEQVAGTVSDVSGEPIKTGDVVTFLDVHETCGRCYYCQVARTSTRCPHRRVYGITYSASEGLLGGWSQKVYLKPGVHVLRLPPALSPERFIGGGCGLPTAFHAVERAGVRLGESVVIQGSGPVGLAAVMLARLSGALQVIVVGGPRLRLDMALRLEAELALDIGDLSPAQRVQAVLDATGGRGADVTIEATGVPAALSEGMAMTRDGGRYVVAGQYTDAGEVSFNPHRLLNQKHLSLLGCWGTDLSHLYRGMALLSKFGSRFPLELTISHRYGLSGTGQALLDVEKQRVIKAVIDPSLP